MQLDSDAATFKDGQSGHSSLTAKPLQDCGKVLLAHDPLDSEFKLHFDCAALHSSLVLATLSLKWQLISLISYFNEISR